MTSDRLRRILKVVIFGVLAVGVFGALIMLLWNWLMPTLFGLHQITFWQALGLFLLSRLLVGGFKGGQPHGSRRWRRRMMERWARMTPEEREKFRDEMRQDLRRRWCPPEPETDPSQ